MSRAVEVASRIEHQAGKRQRTVDGPVNVSAKVTQYLFHPASIGLANQLEGCAAAIDARLIGRTVEIAGGVEDQAGSRKDSRLYSVEVKQHALGPAAGLRRTQLEHSTAVQG